MILYYAASISLSLLDTISSLSSFKTIFNINAIVIPVDIPDTKMIFTP